MILVPLAGLAMLAGVGCGSPSDFTGPIRGTDVNYSRHLGGLFRSLQTTDEYGHSANYHFYPLSDHGIWTVSTDVDGNTSSWHTWSLNDHSADAVELGQRKADGFIDEIRTEVQRPLR